MTRLGVVFSRVQRKCIRKLRGDRHKTLHFTISPSPHPYPYLADQTENDILDFSKIESGKMDLEEQPFDLRACIEDSIDLLATKAAEKKLELP